MASPSISQESSGSRETGNVTNHTVTLSDDVSTITVQTGTVEQSVHFAYRLTGCADPASNPPDSTVGSGSSQNPDPPPHTPAGGSADYLWIAMFASDGGQQATAYPSGYTLGQNTWESNTGTGGTCGIGLAAKQATGSSDNPSAFTMDATDEWACATMAVPPGDKTLEIVFFASDSVETITWPDATWNEFAYRQSAASTLAVAWKDVTPGGAAELKTLPLLGAGR